MSFLEKIDCAFEFSGIRLHHFEIKDIKVLNT